MVCHSTSALKPSAHRVPLLYRRGYDSCASWSSDWDDQMFASSSFQGLTLRSEICRCLPTFFKQSKQLLGSLFLDPPNGVPNHGDVAHGWSHSAISEVYWRVESPSTFSRSQKVVVRYLENSLIMPFQVSAAIDRFLAASISSR